MALSIKDRYKALVRTFKIVLDPKVEHLTLMWRDPESKDTLTHTFYEETDSTRPVDVVLDLFSRVVGHQESLNDLNSAASNMLLRAVSAYTEHNNIPYNALVVYEKPICLREEMHEHKPTVTMRVLTEESD